MERKIFNEIKKLNKDFEEILKNIKKDFKSDQKKFKVCFLPLNLFNSNSENSEKKSIYKNLESKQYGFSLDDYISVEQSNYILISKYQRKLSEFFLLLLNKIEKLNEENKNKILDFINEEDAKLLSVFTTSIELFSFLQEKAENLIEKIDKNAFESIKKIITKRKSLNSLSYYLPYYFIQRDALENQIFERIVCNDVVEVNTRAVELLSIEYPFIKSNINIFIDELKNIFRFIERLDK